MSITLKKISDDVAREVTMHLLNWGCFTQNAIAKLVGRSQSWVSWIKQEKEALAMRKKISDDVAREVTMYLLNRGCFTQNAIAELVGRSQSWVSWIKQEMDMIASNTLSCPNNTPPFQFITPNSAISRW